MPCERFNEHALTHQTSNLGCQCSLLGGPKALAKVFLVTKPGQWTDWWVMGCGSFRTHPDQGCGLFGKFIFEQLFEVSINANWVPVAPLGRKDSPMEDRDSFRQRLSGDDAPLHYYPIFGDEPAPPPTRVIPKPSCFNAPRVVQVGDPGSSLYGTSAYANVINWPC